jgi:hypothetical protein
MLPRLFQRKDQQSEAPKINSHFGKLEPVLAKAFKEKAGNATFARISKSPIGSSAAVLLKYSMTSLLPMLFDEGLVPERVVTPLKVVRVNANEVECVSLRWKSLSNSW